MSARVVNLEIIQQEDGPWFEFSWLADPADWREALRRLKAEMPFGARAWDPERKVWRVHGAFESELAGIFENFESILDGMRSQLTIPW